MTKKDDGDDRDEETNTKTKKQQPSSPLLEINLISAQGLKPPGVAGAGRVQTYALAWVNSDAKLRTRVDKVGGANPTWNDRFLFRVSPEFLASEISAVDVEIYAVGLLRDSLLGSVRLLLGNFLDAAAKSPSFTALQIRRPSGRCQGVLNVGAMVIPSSDLSSAFAATRTAVGYRDLMGENLRRQSRRKERRNEPENVSDGDDSSSTSTSTSSSSSSTAMKELNAVREVAGTKGLGLGLGLGFGLKGSTMPHCSSFFCGLVREVQIQPRPLDEIKPRRDSCDSTEKER